MSDIHHYGLFVLAAIVLILTPGQDTLYILGRSLSGGLRAGVASALGITVGSVVHTLAAAAGLSLLLRAFPPAFVAVKLCGAAYLIYLGARLLLARKRRTRFNNGACPLRVHGGPSCRARSPIS